MDNYLLNRSSIFNHLFSLIILFPVVFSFLFKMVGLPIPSYLFIIITSLLLLPFIASNLLTISKSWLKFSIYVFFAWILSSIVYTTSRLASEEKFIAIIYNTILPVLLVELFFLSSKLKNVNFSDFNPTLLKYSYLLLWFCFVAYIFFKKADESGRYSLPGVENAIWFSRFVGMLLLIILCCAKLKMSNFLLYTSSILIALVLMFGGGSRGPLLAVIIAFFVKQSYFMSKKKLVVLISSIGLLIAIGFLFIGGYLFETNFYSIYARVDLIKSFEDFDFPIFTGNGIGSYGMSFLGEDVVYYPHNVFLELFFENGLVGVLLFFVVLFFFFKSFRPNIIYFLALYYLLASLVSGDIPGNNNLFILLFIATYASVNDLQMKNGKAFREENFVLKNE